MQTFLPVKSFINTALILDNKRLGKQHVEAYQILKTLLQGTHKDYIEGQVKKKTPWYNHPSTQMWKGYEGCLALYTQCVCQVWKSKGFKDTINDKVIELFVKHNLIVIYPKWLGDERLHSSHRSNPLRKNPEFYNKFGWVESNDLPYFWPTKSGY